MNRRSFLKVGTTLAGGLLVKGFSAPKAFANGDAAISPDNPLFFAEFLRDGTIHLRLGKHEMGQSAPTGVAMLFAEELGADWDSIRVSQMQLNASSKPFYDSPFGGTTGGSSSVSGLWDAMRNAGASVREMLIQAASDNWQIDQEELASEGGFVLHAKSGRKASFFELSKRVARLEVPESPALRHPNTFKIIGKSKPNARNRELSMAKLEYGIDKALPGMRYAAIIRCPVWGGALKSFDARAALRQAGVSEVFSFEGDFNGQDPFNAFRPGVAVVADSTWNAFKAKKLVEVEWDLGVNGRAGMDTITRSIAERDFIKSEATSDYGDPDAVFASSERIHEAVYESHFQPHAALEPLSGTATASGDRIEVWSSAQNPKACREEIAKALGIPEDGIVVNNLVAGGSFGRRANVDFVVEAAIVAHRLQGPVKVTWSREDDFSGDFYHPYKHSHWKASLDASGDLSALKSDFAILGAPDFWWALHAGFMPFGLKDQKVTGNMIELPVAVGAWRSVVEHLCAFSEDAFFDELAHKAGRDPYRYRVDHVRKAIERHASDDYWGQMLKRTLALLEMVPTKLDWAAPLPAGRGRGISISKFASTVVVQVAEVEVLKRDFRVKKVDAFVGAGLAVNPQLAENQIEGSIVWALSALKHGRLTFENGRMRESNFDEFELVRMDEVPEMKVHFLTDDGPMGGMGEPGVPGLAPAVLNAIFAASGKRLRTLPVDLEELA